MKIRFTQEAWKDFEWFLDKDREALSQVIESMLTKQRMRRVLEEASAAN